MIPSPIKIVGREVTVNVVDDFDKMGESQIDDDVIVIKGGQSPFNECDTVVHEIIHFIDERFQLNLSERKVYCMSVGLLNVLKDNPTLIDYIKEAIEK